MALQRDEAVWLTEAYELTLTELTELSGLTEAEVRELVDYGCIAPVDAGATQWVFKGRCVTTVRAASRLRSGFDLEPHGVALVVSLLDRINDLEAQLNALRAQMPHRIR